MKRKTGNPTAGGATSSRRGGASASRRAEIGFRSRATCARSRRGTYLRLCRIRWTMQVCTCSGRSHRSPLGSPSAADAIDQDVLDAALLELAEDLHPELGALGLLEPQPEHIRSPSTVTPKAR